MTDCDQKLKLSKDNNQENLPEIIQEYSNKSNTVPIRKYKKGHFLGKGGFARCYEIQNLQTKKISAIKIISKQTLKKSKAKQKLITEIKIHKSLSNKNIVSFDHVFEDSQNVYIVLQLCNNHTLNEMLKKRRQLSEIQVQYFLMQIIQGVKYLHNNKVIHRDLKLGNLMINEEMEIKIGDFGLAAKLQFNTEKRKTICGTPNYLAPEIIDAKGHSYEVDIWSLGVIMYALLFGRPPFQTNDVKKTYKRIKQCQYTFNEDVNVSHNAKNLISRILIVDPSKRLTLDQILCHPFINSNKIPKSLPVSCLSNPLPKSFIDQYTYYGGNLGSSKFQNSMKALQKVENEYEKTKLQKGISQRLLLKTSAGFSRNFFTKPKQESQLNTQQKNVLSNNFFNKPQTPKNKQRLSLSKTNHIFVKKWVDYSSKYGLGYLLSDGSTGIYFNDSTKMCIDNMGQKIDYVTNQTEEDKVLVTMSASQGNSDREITKKITLMQYFRKYLNGGTVVNEQQPITSCSTQRKAPFVYIKKWIKSQQGILFRLNTKLIQVNFNDKTQLMIYGDSQIIVYCGKNNEKITITLDNHQQQLKKYHEFSVKMQQTKSMLKKMNVRNSSANNNGRMENVIDLQSKQTIKAY